VNKKGKEEGFVSGFYCYLNLHKFQSKAKFHATMAAEQLKSCCAKAETMEKSDYGTAALLNKQIGNYSLWRGKQKYIYCAVH